jgi:hypothetical protein
VALILAINPGNTHSPTLARLARELKGCELVGAESCAVAITAIKQRRPDVVLLPDKTPRGEAELLVALNRIPGGVPTLKLPPVASAEPAVLAKEIRTILAGNMTAPRPPAPAVQPVVVSPHLVAAAKAMVTWGHARRASWSNAVAVPVFEPMPIAAGAAFSPEPYEPHEPNEPYEPYEPSEPRERDGRNEPREPPSPSDMFGDQAATTRSSWLPRVAIFGGLIVLVGAGVYLWPAMSSSGSAAVTHTSTASEPEQVQTAAATPPPVEPAPPVMQPAETPPDPADSVSGWVAVFAPFDVTVANGNEPLALDDSGRAMLASGRHRLRFQNADVGYDETRTVQIKPTETTTINLQPQTPLQISSNEAAEVLVDGVRAGETPYKGRMPFGPHTLTVRTPAGSERQFPVDPTMKPVQLEVDFSKP